MTRLVLIRHGETDYSLKKRYCGFSNPPLNNKGIRQSEELAARLKGMKIDSVYSSDLKRAYQTARLIFKDSSIIKSADFREMNFGRFEGLRYEEAIKKYPKFYRDWIDNPIKVNIPDGEGLNALYKRVKSRLSAILSENKGRTIALITHGGPIRVILCDKLSLGLEKFWQVEQALGSLKIIDYPERIIS